MADTRKETDHMYIGRFVITGRTSQGQPFLGYRVSSRSFPNRRIVVQGHQAVVLPTPDAAPSDNPYIAYNCLRSAGDTTVVANGSHADPIIEKVSAGYPLRDALALVLLALDYEHDDYDTPRIAAAWQGETTYLAIVTPQRLLVTTVHPEAGDAYLVATYGLTEPTLLSLQGADARTLAEAIYHAPYEHPVAALAVIPGVEDGSASFGPIGD
jgi:IMP cyclohydrolase